MSDIARSAATCFWRGPGGEGGVSRPLIVAAVVIGVAWTVAAALIHVRVNWLFAVLHVGLVLLAALVASFLLGIAKPTGFVVQEGVGFVVTASRGFGYLVVREVLMLAFLTGQLIHIWTWLLGGGADEAVAERSAVLIWFRPWARKHEPGSFRNGRTGARNISAGTWNGLAERRAPFPGRDAIHRRRVPEARGVGARPAPVRWPRTGSKEDHMAGETLYITERGDGPTAGRRKTSQARREEC
jgi:hypothetical protein